MTEWKNYLDYMFAGNFTVEDYENLSYKQANLIKNDCFSADFSNLRDYEFLLSRFGKGERGIVIVHTNFVNALLKSKGFDELFTMDEYLSRKSMEKEPTYVKVVETTFGRQVEPRWYIVANKTQEAVALITEDEIDYFIDLFQFFTVKSFAEGLSYLKEFHVAEKGTPTVSGNLFKSRGLLSAIT